MYQNTSETVKYVLTANTSQTRGELKLTHNEPNSFGNGSGQYANHGRPMCDTINVAAQTTAKMVIASAERLMDKRHF